MGRSDTSKQEVRPRQASQRNVVVVEGESAGGLDECGGKGAMREDGMHSLPCHASGWMSFSNVSFSAAENEHTINSDCAPERGINTRRRSHISLGGDLDLECLDVKQWNRATIIRTQLGWCAFRRGTPHS